MTSCESWFFILNLKYYVPAVTSSYQFLSLNWDFLQALATLFRVGTFSEIDVVIGSMFLKSSQSPMVLLLGLGLLALQHGGAFDLIQTSWYVTGQSCGFRWMWFIAIINLGWQLYITGVFRDFEKQNCLREIEMLLIYSLRFYFQM